jgi:hypothetical protein
MDEIFSEKDELKGGETGRGSEFPLIPPFKPDLSKSVPHIKEIPKLPINSLFVAVQLIGEKKEVEFGKGKKRYYINFGGYAPKTAREKALFISIYYALIYYATKYKDKILLTDLMENIGYPKKIGHGYLEYQKEEVLEMVWNVARSEIGVSGPVVPTNIKKLFPDVEKRDIFKMNIFSINIIKQYSHNKKLKEVVILFKPNFDTDLIRFNKISEVLGLPISEPEYKNLAIYIVYGSNLKNAERITKIVREVLEIAKIDIDEIHPERTFNKLLFALRKIRVDGYIDRWEWNPFPDIRDIEKGEFRGDRGWFAKWLDSKVVVVLPNKR